MKLEKKMGDMPYYSHKNSSFFDMFIVIGLVFNALITVFVVLYWLELL